MTEPQAIEIRAQQCQNSEDYANLAAEIATVDLDHAQALLKQAELQCQLPADYIHTATGYMAMSEPEYAAELLEQAEESCFEAMEFAAVGQAWAKLLNKSEKAGALLQQAAAEVQARSDKLTLVQAAVACGADELAQSLLEQVTQSCKTLEDYAELADILQQRGDQDKARALFATANKFCDDIASTVRYAKTAGELFQDPELQRNILEQAETDCQFPKEFVQLATGYYQLLADSAKVDELLEQGTEFAFSGSEHLDLALGYLQLKQDQHAAAEAYRKALPDITDRLILQEMGKTAACELGDRELAKTIYTKLEQRSQNTAERLALAQSILDDIDDQEHAVALYQRIEEQLTAPRDLIDLAVRIAKNLADKAWATAILLKALDQSSGYQPLGKLFDCAVATVNNPAVSQTILKKWRAAAESSTELLNIYQAQGKILNEPEEARKLLLTAEERIASLGEMQHVVKTVAEDFPEDAAWQQRLNDKLQRREANQSAYATLQEQEQQATEGLQLIRLGREVMQRLGDEYFCHKLFDTAHTLLQEQPLDLYVYEQLLEGIEKQLADHEWAVSIVQGLTQRCHTVAQISQLAGLAHQTLQDPNLAARLLHDFSGNMATGEPGLDGLLQLATAVWQQSQDRNWLEQLLSTATESAATLYDWVSIGKLAQQADLGETAVSAYSQATASCQNAEQFRQLYALLSSTNLPRKEIDRHYAMGARTLTSARERLHWAEGIIELTGDREWAQKAYQQLAAELTKDPMRKLFRNSQKLWLQGHL